MNSREIKCGDYKPKDRAGCLTFLWDGTQNYRLTGKLQKTQTRKGRRAEQKPATQNRLPFPFQLFQRFAEANLTQADHCSLLPVSGAHLEPAELGNLS